MDDEGIFVIQDAGEVLVVNRVGAFIVEQLRGGRSLDQVVTSVTERSSVDAEQARADTTSLLGELLRAGAIARS